MSVAKPSASSPRRRPSAITISSSITSTRMSLSRTSCLGPLNGRCTTLAHLQHGFRAQARSSQRPDEREEAMRTRVLALAAILLTGLFAWAPGGGETAVAAVNPADFSAPVANPYFPLKVGTVFVYRGTEGADRLVEHL